MMKTATSNTIDFINTDLSGGYDIVVSVTGTHSVCCLHLFLPTHQRSARQAYIFALKLQERMLLKTLKKLDTAALQKKCSRSTTSENSQYVILLYNHQHHNSITNSNHLCPFILQPYHTFRAVLAQPKQRRLYVHLLASRASLSLLSGLCFLFLSSS